MSSCSTAVSAEVGDFNHPNVLPAEASLSKSSETPLEHKNDEKEDEDENKDEDEDVDFQPFLKETPSLEASSSLSSEIEGLDADVADSGKNTCAALVNNSMSKPSDSVQDYAVGDSEHGEEIVMQTTISSEGACEKVSENTSSTKLIERRPVLISQLEEETCIEKNGSSSRTDVVNDVIGQVDNTAHSRKLNMHTDAEDAICMRTRARYSLASFTLDELETFLQETDDDDDLQKVDDEEEYRKFLAAVLQGGDGSCQILQDNENVDEEDEDNDADFELEIEEALESDLDENTRDKTHEQDYEAVGRRPKTRRNRRQKDSVKHKKKLLGQLNRPLRPLLPIAPAPSFKVFDGKSLMPKNARQCLLSSANNGSVNGFSPHQIGQLHGLIHEHVQLLIQVFSVCVLEPARQRIASELRGLISEMLHTRDQVLSWRRVPYPSFCFCGPHIHPSVSDGYPKNLPAQGTFESSSSFDPQRECSSVNNMLPLYNIISPSKGRHECFSHGQVGRFPTTEGSFWMPYISGPILSVLDVAPLALVGSYIDDVSTAVQDYQCRYLEVSGDNRFQREPLFPLHSFHSSEEANGQVSRGIVPPASKMVLSSSASDQMPRKTMAAALVERAKKQSVALVPKEIAKLAHRFFPLFNPALYPHKPPPSPVANRVLFTDAEDELLAMGLMEYNTDWKAIQQRFLPCKSKHQIFVRQKNRSSSKAPENPIKAVRRMKNSPLTDKEKARIEEGLKVFKLDWMSVWKFVVPYRDPSLLPRQWRIATGTQKSYKMDADKKVKRRLYESKRRKSKPAAASWHTSSGKEDYSTDNAGEENNSADDCMDKEDEAYVHEAFFADWRPGNSSVSLKHPDSGWGEKNPPTVLHSVENSLVREQMNSGCGISQPQIGQELPSAFRSSNSEVCVRPNRARSANNAFLVKLAPDLPPLNLPPSVRVMSQSAFKTYQGGAFTKVSDTEACSGIPGTENIVPNPASVVKSGTNYPEKAVQNRNNLLKSSISNQGSGVLRDKCFSEEKDGSGLQMHPLLFQAPEDGCLPYYPSNSSTSNPCPFNFFPGNQPHLNLSLFRNPHQVSNTAKFFDKSLKSKVTATSSALGFDFHPLLQRTDNVNCDSVALHSTAQPSVTSEPLRGIGAPFQNPFDAFLAKSHINSRPSATCAKLSSPNRESEEPDLDVQLSCKYSKPKAVGSRNACEHNPVVSIISVSEAGNSEFEKNTTNSLDHCSSYVPTASTSKGLGQNLDSGAHASVKSSNGRNENNVDIVGDLSLPEIVMEQEELSDSDEEIGENVEFECEEMADSEGEEGSDSEQNLNIQNKAAKVATDVDINHSQCEPSTYVTSEGNACGPSEGSTIKLGLTDQEEENNPWSSLCLDLNSCPPGSLPTKPNLAMHRYCSAGQLKAPAHSNRCCTNTLQSTKHGTLQKHAVSTPQPPCLDSVTVASLRKPRKRACITDSSVCTGRAKRRDLNVNTDTTEESSNRDKNDESG
ncbi:unnamed protein product [Ilex paraguariensis]|uniref:Homeodomain-like superfamily protein n=1 Tax=Ilex paraguariensis TaxID=185542 RepID=A0ABC8UJK7_9AQUA